MAHTTTETRRLALVERQGGKVIEVAISGRLQREDYDHFVPTVEAAIKLHGKVRMIVIMGDFKGWSAGALWQDIKFDLKHFNDIERLALVGESKWEEGMAKFCKPFTTADVRFFHSDSLKEARDWTDS